MKTRILGRVLACAAATCTSVASGETTAREYTLDIGQKPIVATLRDLSIQTGVSVAVIADGIDQQRVLIGPLKGRYTVESALSELLADSELTFVRVDAATILVTARNDAPKGRANRVGGAMKLQQPPSAKQRFLTVAMAETGAAGGGDSRQRSVARGDQPARDNVMEEVVVTAQKRAELLIDTPQSVSVLSAASLEKLNATQFRDFADTVPGLSFSTSGAGYTKISLRGVTAGADVSPTVGIYVDEVPYGSSTPFALGPSLALDIGLFDLDRIEVLRGPQGTLYGASTMGGLIKYVSRTPSTAEFSGNAQAGISGTQDGGTNYNAAVAVNAPLVTDKLAVRASSFYSRDGGYIDNEARNQQDVNRAEIYGGRADLLFTPTEALSVRIATFAQDISRDGEGTADYTGLGVPRDGSLEQSRALAEPFEQRFRLASATVNYDLDWSALTSVSSYQTADTELIFDFTPVYVPVLSGPPFRRSYSAFGLQYDLSTDRFTQEVRLASQGTATLEWLFGGFYTREQSDNNIVGLPFDLAGQPTTNDLYLSRRPSRYEEYAAFGDLTWRITETFDVTGGVRYARNELETQRMAAGLLIGPQAPNSATDEVFTYLANARYHFNRHATAYLRYATGYRPGGPNFTTRNPTTGLPVGPESFEADRLKSYEMGFKAETADRRWGVDVAGYYIDWDNIQVSIARSGFAGIVNAAGGAEIRGSEVSFTARPADALMITSGFAYQDARLSKTDLDLRAAKGERLPNVPRYTATLGVDYELQIGDLQPTIGATLRYVDDRKANFGTTAYPLPDYTAVDLRTGVEFGMVTAQIYVRNLFDERGQLSSAITPPAPPHTAILQPRTIGLNLTTRF